MRKVVLQMMTSLNGRVDDPGAWMAGIGEDLYEEIDRLYATFDTILVGGTTYREMFEYWPTAADEAGASQAQQRMARKMNSYKKLMITGRDRLMTLPWNNAEQVLSHSDDDLRRIVADQMGQAGGDIHLAGGARLAQAFVRLDLVDRYNLFVHPVISMGATWMEQAKGKRDLRLVKETAFGDGVVGLYYEPQPG